MIDIGCGTGLNFALIEEVIGPTGRIVGVDLTDAMLARARQRIETRGWSNISLVHADAAEFEFPAGVDAILATYAHSLLPEPSQVVAHGAAALPAGGRWVVLDLKIPDNTPRWLTQLGIATVGRSNALEEWIVRRPWEAIRVAMQDTLADSPGPNCSSASHTSLPGRATLGPRIGDRREVAMSDGRKLGPLAWPYPFRLTVASNQRETRTATAIRDYSGIARINCRDEYLDRLAYAQ